ncbi:MAG: hypothetical protein AAFU79_24550 [Myxococcota bacterium]
MNPSIRPVASLLVISLEACGGEVPLQVVEGTLDLEALGETSLVVQARNVEGDLQAASPTEPSGDYVLFVPPATFSVTASGRVVHDLGMLRVCAVGPPHRMVVDPSPPTLSEACLAARSDLAECRRTVEPACDVLEVQVRACRGGDPVEECAAEAALLERCLEVRTDCDSEAMAVDRCRQAICDDRLAQYVDGGCIEGCQAPQDAVLSACTSMPRNATVTEVGCSSSP